MATQPVNLSGEGSAFFAATADVPETLGDAAPQGVDAGELGAPQPVVGGLTVEAVAMAFGTIFAFVGARLGEDGKFWELQDAEKAGLATAWLPVLNPLWQKWVSGADPNLVMALLITGVTIGPRLVRTNALLASRTESTETERSGASSSSPGRPAVVSQLKPIA
jgi:hypothetical protein